ncbi:MAG TPA: HEPN domain-containing protein [Streptosporangiaceae bacterium]|nr:HEPN domain-containing protein [Streptosporangiaceae bacterium]
MRWDQGRAGIDRMLADAELQRVPPSREQADSLIAQARIHLTSATSICDQDPPGAYALVYDAARKALTAVLENQGLRPTTRGGHLATYDAVRAQLDPPLGKILRPFDRMRRQRHDAEYPPADTPPLTTGDVHEDIPKAIEIITMSERVLDQMSPY